MKQISIECWEVYSSYDRDTTHMAYFDTEDLAIAFIHQHANRNYMSKNIHRKNYVIFESIEEMDEYSKVNLRKSGLAKLTNLEKEALGLKG